MVLCGKISPYKFKGDPQSPLIFYVSNAEVFTVEISTLTKSDKLGQTRTRESDTQVSTQVANKRQATDYVA